MDTKTLVANKLTQLEQDIFATYADHSTSSFLCGKGGLPLLYYKLYTIYDQESYRQKAATILDSLLDEISAGLGSSSYCDGLAGLASMLSYLVEHNILDEGAEEFLTQCDTALYQSFLKTASQANLDYLHGALGVAFYFLHRQLATPAVTDTLVLVGEEMLRQLAPTLVPAPGQYVNCGMAHGQLAALMFLVKYLPVAPQPERVEATIRAIVQQVQRYKSTDPTSRSQFPSIVQLRDNTDLFDTTYDIPNGWCYGDTMLSLVLLAASEALHDDELRATATAIALRSTERNTPQKALIVDGAMCHGAAGLAHLYKKWHQATGHPQFRASYEYWIGQTLLMGNRPDGPGGYQKNMGDGIYATTYGLLDGACGIGLVLADFVADSPDEPSDWDRFFALS
ncbi:lanthionine synthetase C family protein [Hymenobacter algoricola]|uniref:Lanthionine synthetase n=1 Tax=Hymenobacter algoricola TaxID=486267 RepID=A0ABP7NQY7_9BACT